MTAARRVAVIIASWEAVEQTLACLESVRDQQVPAGCELRCVVCDDNSSIDVVQELTDAIEALDDPRVQLVTSRQRGGFAANINRGIAATGDFQPDFFWLLNNDTRLASGALEALLACASAKPAVSAWGSTVVAGLTGDRLECAGGYRYSRWSTRNFGAHVGAAISAIETLVEPELDYISGAAMFCKAELLQSAGGLCEDFFLYFEELDLLKRSGESAQLGWCRGSLVFHAGASTTGRAGEQRSRLQQYCENYSTLLYTRRHDPLLLPWVLVSRLVVKPVKFLARAEWHLYRPFAVALWDFLRGAPPRHFS